MTTHTPKVVITTPVPHNSVTPNILTKIEVDGELWPVLAYSIDSDKSVNDFQRITLTFVGDVTVIHAGEVVR